MSAVVLVALVLLPAGAGAVLACLGRAADRVAGRLAVGVAAATLVGSLVVAWSRPEVSTPFLAGADLVLRVDALGALVAPTVAAVATLVLVFAVDDVTVAPARFHGLMLVFAAAALLTVVAGTLPTLLLGWEVMGATSYALIGFHWRRSETVDSGLTAFLVTRTTDLGLYVAAAGVLAGGGAWDLARLDQASPGWRVVVAVGIAVAALGKAAQLPFSFWLSRAMDGPSPVSALLHSAAMVALGGFLLLRAAPVLAATGWVDDVVAWVGALTAVVLGLVALAQRDLKQLLAASTSAQLGFVVLAAGLGAVGGGAVHLVAHAAVKALLFLAAGAWLSALGTKDLDALRGAARRWPLVGAAASAGLLSLAGLAPLALWATKDVVLAAALERSPWLYAAGLLGAALSTAYAAKALLVLWAPLPADAEAGYDQEEAGTRRVTPAMTVPLVVLAGPALGLGVLALPVLADPVRRALGDPSPLPGAVELVVSALLAALVLAAAVALRSRPLRVPRLLGPLVDRAESWVGLEALAHRLVVRPTLRLARAADHVDARVLDRGVAAIGSTVTALAGAVRRLDARGLDRGVGAVGAATVALGGTSRRVDASVVQGAVGSLAAGVRRLGRVSLRPQSGQLHQYYLQAAVLLAVAVVVLLVSVR